MFSHYLLVGMFLRRKINTFFGGTSLAVLVGYNVITHVNFGGGVYV